jgi:sodium-dependent dicarboxylate transporter 2/3/5
MHTIQVAIFFVISYLLSRVFVVLKIPELVLYYLFEKKHVSIQKLTFILILGSALLSSVIANVITVLTLMPLVLLLQKEFDRFGKDQLKINTLFLLSVIWGANIGGLGMVTGTTTNGILIGLYEVFKVPVGRDFTFLSWMSWGLPLQVVLSCIGWLILMAVFQPGKMMHQHDFRAKLESYSMSRKLQKKGFALAAFFVLSASLLSAGMNILHVYRLEIMILTVLWMIVFVYYLVFHYWETEDKSKLRLLMLKDTLHDIPKKGILWISIGVIITFVFWYFKLHKSAGYLLRDLFEGKSNMLMFYCLIGLIATFASELFSNSGVQITMFMVLFPMTKYNPNLSWEGMLIITLCSTCAFMSPIGTPSNGLGFGSSSKISIRHMLSAGFVMNIASALVISLWVTQVVPVINKYLL